MREWRRVSVITMCGGCGNIVPAETPMQIIKIPGVKREKVRCSECVGDAPPDLPARIVTRAATGGGFTKPATPIQRTAAQFTRARLSDADWTARIMGERE